MIPKVIQVNPQGSMGHLTKIYVGLNKKWGSQFVSDELWGYGRNVAAMKFYFKKGV